MTLVRKVLRYFFVLCGFLALTLLACHSWIVIKSQGLTYNDPTVIPENEVALVLGTSKRVKNGNVNLFFRYRMDAAAKLYRSGKIKHILVSGDNHSKFYNEGKDMQQALVERGIPVKDITIDYAGFRTFDSVVRARKIFGQTKFTIISQRFHNQRAIFIARAFDIDAIGFNARGISASAAASTFLREYLARVMAVLDVYILRSTPKYLGKPEPIHT